MAFEEVTNYINEVRRDFAQKELNESAVNENPFEQLGNWIEEAINAQILDPYAMVISTANIDGKPSSRVVYLRGIYNEGLVFYTNYNSQKGKDLIENPQIALNFFWGEVERQVRIEGEVEMYSAEGSDKYFDARPRESKIGAWVSSQSEEIASKEELTKRFEEFQQKFEGKEVPRPPHWGGFLVKPNYFEFWQGRPSRLHDRIFYQKTESNWKLGRLMP
jgi:pyridoxamine 5'-phosphate oxidase